MRNLRFLSFMIIAALLAPSAAAVTTLDYGIHQVSVTLQSGEEVAYLVNMNAGDHLTVNLRVTEGGHVDFYLTNLTAYNAYKSGHVDSLYFLGGQSRMDASLAQYSYDSLAANEYVILIDNTASTVGGASPTGPVTVEGTITVEKNIWTAQNIAITVAVIVGIALFMAYLRWPGRKQRGN
jgi:hypothetical protein